MPIEMYMKKAGPKNYSRKNKKIDSGTKKEGFYVSGGKKLPKKMTMGAVKYYSEGAQVLSGRQHNLPDHLKKKIIAAKKN